MFGRIALGGSFSGGKNPDENGVFERFSAFFLARSLIACIGIALARTQKSTLFNLNFIPNGK